MKRWFVVNTKPGAEKLAQTHLERQGFTVYLPRMIKKLRHQRRPVAPVEVPLFPRYLFVQIDLAVDAWHCINNTIGVARLVSFGKLPSAVSHRVIDEIRQREDEDGIVRLSRMHRFKQGDQVAIVEGALMDRTGIFQCETDKERVIVLLNLLGREISVTVGQDALHKIA